MRKATLTVLALCATLSCAGMARATTITPKLQATEKKVCEERKLIAQGILELCLNVNSGKMILGAMDNSATCATNFNTALANADTLAASYGTACRYVDNGDGTVKRSEHRADVGADDRNGRRHQHGRRQRRE
jgi:hypothetical protein